MSSNNLSQGGAKRTPANNSEDGARSKGTSKENEDKESSGKDETPKEEVIEKEAKDVNNKGPVLAPLYKPFPPDINFSCDGINCVLELKAEDVADLYARMMDHMHKTIKAINKQIKKVLTANQKEPFKDQKECDFFGLLVYFLEQAKLRLNLTQGGANNSEDGARSKGTSKECPKIEFSCDGKNCVPELKAEEVADLYARMMDHMHKTIKAINKQIEKVMTANQKAQFKDQKEWDFSELYDYLLEQAKLRMEMTEGEREWMKYETARKLKKRLKKIRDAYKEDWVHKYLYVRQQGVALYFIDKLAFRAGNEKEKWETADKEEEGETVDEEEEGETADEEEEGETADKEEEGETADKEEEGETACAVGCCNLRVEHIELQKDNFVKFDFVGRSKIRYQNRVPVEKEVYENIQDFIGGKQGKDELFDKLTPLKLNNYLKEWMPGLTIKVFRTCNASITLQDKLKELTVAAKDSLESKLQAYHQAVEAAAVLCNHQRTASKTSEKQTATEKTKKSGNKKKKQLVKNTDTDLSSLEEGLKNMDINEDKEESMQIYIATTIGYYLDPRISVAWCKKWEVPVEEVYSPALMKKFKWAIDMAEKDYEF